ncbi:MAG TPA: hypothetical protein VI584_00875, partial [Nitrospiria bacterium]|nr:hypothetical protein [Nitrospiria bacterium]
MQTAPGRRGGSNARHNREKRSKREKPRNPKLARRNEAESPTSQRRNQWLKTKANPTDPDSRIMKTRRGYVQGSSGQAVVTEGQIIVAAELT